MLPPAKMILQFVIDISILYHKPISLNIFNSTLDWEIEMANTLFRTANEGGISVLTKQSSNVVAVEAFLCNDGKGRMISQSEVRLKRDNVYLIPKTIGDLRPNLNEEVFVYSLNGDVISIHEVYFIKGK